LKSSSSAKMSSKNLLSRANSQLSKSSLAKKLSSTISTPTGELVQAIINKRMIRCNLAF
jgi:hypothetical protein